MVLSLLGWVSCNGADNREGDKIIRENVNGTKEVIVDEHDVFYVCPVHVLT